jgi:hypothetical protein
VADNGVVCSRSRSGNVAKHREFAMDPRPTLGFPCSSPDKVTQAPIDLWPP